MADSIQNINYRTTNLPDYLDKPYQEYMGLYGGQVAADLKAGMPEYGKERIAGLSEVQQNAMNNALAMQPSKQLDAATGLMGAATYNALNTNYKPGDFSAFSNYQPGTFSSGTFGEAEAKQYMNPYQQAVTDIGKREAARQSDIRAAQEAGQATQAGAFGGSRFAIQQAERDRNLGQQMADIQAQGSNAAFQAAMSQYNADQARRMQAQQMGEQSRQFGSSLGLQGAQLGEQSRQYGAGLGLQGQQAAMQGAGALGTLGNLQYQQQMGINQLQQGYGGMQQNIEQQRKNIEYQDFLNRQNYPYQLLNQYGNVLNRQPANMNVMQTTYGQSPSMGGQLLGTAGSLVTSPGAKNVFGFADGGTVKRYEEGGITDSRDVTDESYIAKLIEKLSLPQLQAILGNPAAPKMEKVLAADQIERLQQMQASSQRGLYGAAQNTPNIEQMYPAREVRAANGGIVAFAGGDDDGSFVIDPMMGTMQSTTASDDDRTMLEKLGLGNRENRRVLEASEAAARKKAEQTKQPAQPAPSVAAPSKPVSAPVEQKSKNSDDYLANLMKQLGGTDAKGLSSALKGMPSSYKDEVYKNAQELGINDKAVLDKLDSMLERDKKRSEDFKNDSSRMYWNQFFSGIAKRSAEPGQNGIRGVMTAISESAGNMPAYEATLRKQQDMYDMLRDKNETDNLKYQVALKNQRFDEALGLEKAIKDNQYQMAHLQQQAAATAAHTKLGLAQLAEQHGYHQMLGDYYQGRVGAMEGANKARMAAAEAKVMPMFQADRGARELAAALRKQYGDNWQQQAEPQRQYQQYYNLFKAKALPSLMSEGTSGIPQADALLGSTPYSAE